ncbi:hypothetical protein [Halomarina oriensis]|uniref:Uncharacterized protein n=1 Tax=Halomarina oriensis TaxID=671145 RepID=A0A6B0GI86_9EURY|nr:hypothetical protein [Halomarina oriensis]MWG33149.1 hypothetical protein [Halomarina oriensis]
MSPPAAAAGQVSGFREGKAPTALNMPTPTVDTESETKLSEMTKQHLGEERGEYLVERARFLQAFKEQWTAKKTLAFTNYVHRNTGMRLNQGAQGVVGIAIGIIATLMIGVVVLGRIDGFTPDMSGQWQNVQDNTSQQAADTFDFMNLLPFLVVALFVLGIVMSRM